jgi:transposase InsO family protein
MGMTMEDEIKRWTAKRKTALVVEITQRKTSISEASCRVISDWIGFYNQKRPHQALKMKTPNQVFEMFKLAD